MAGWSEGWGGERGRAGGGARPKGLGAEGRGEPDQPRPRCAPHPQSARAAGAPPPRLRPAPQGLCTPKAGEHVGAVRELAISSCAAPTRWLCP